MTSIETSVVVITGASSGIGEALAYRYAQRNCKLVLAARSGSQLEVVSRQCTALGAIDVLSVPTDVTNETSCQSLISKTIKTFDCIDILILNAGISSHFCFNETVDVAIYHQLMNTNFFGYLNCTKYAWPHLQRTNGQIVVISSMSGEIGLPERTAYCASKFAVNGFFDALDMEQQGGSADSLVTITMVCPPSVKTNMRNHSIGSSSTSDKYPDKIDSRMPVEQCASLIVEAADKRVKKAYFPLKSSIAVYLRPFFPRLLNPIIRRSSKL